jgi:multiple sugar transport system ATP-binding protein
MADVKLENVTKIYPNHVKAVDNINLSIHDKEFIVMVGPSGCGKSTILRMIAGLEDLTKGDIYIDGENVNEVLPKDRNISMVFQDFALYPHMKVFDNIAFGMRMRKVPREEIEKRVAFVAGILGIEGLLQRKPKQISGGEKQRVALGRAIVRNPRLFLMDEPLSNLDAKLRSQMRIEIHRIYRDLKTTVIYVTHDQTEAMTLGTRVVVLKDGIIQQVDTPKEVYANPTNTFVASFVGVPAMNLIKGKVVVEPDCVKLHLANGYLELTDKLGRQVERAGYTGVDVIAGVRPEHVRLGHSDQLMSINLAGKVEIVENTGSETSISIDTSLGSIVMKVTSGVIPGQGESVFLDIVPERIHLFDINSGKRITYFSDQ